jgi:MFS family permease
MRKLQYRQYMLLLLIVVSVSNYVDRSILQLAMESIKEDFQLSDSQLGLMSGFAFALFYAVAGIPIARWADRGNRNHVISIAAVLWSGMLVLCSMVGNYSQLLLVRAGIAVGESGCMPTSQSLISDYYDREERPRALAILTLGAPIATIISFVGGGWLIEHMGWRSVFFAVGLIGLLLAVITKFTLREPRLEKKSCLATPQPSLKQVVAALWQGHAFRHLMMVYCLVTFFWVGIAVWTPAFFIRSHNVSVTEIGIWIGLSAGVCGFLFTYLGGYFATRYAPGREALQMKSIAVLLIISGGISSVCWLADDKTVALIFMFIAFGAILPMIPAPLYSAVQNLVEERMRAVAMAIVLMFANLIGMGFGPLAVGLISDFLEPSFGQESLRYALALVGPGFLWGAFHAWKTAENIENEIQAVEAKGERNQTTTVDADVPSSLESSPTVG